MLVVQLIGGPSDWVPRHDEGIDHHALTFLAQALSLSTDHEKAAAYSPTFMSNISSGIKGRPFTLLTGARLMPPCRVPPDSSDVSDPAVQLVDCRVQLKRVNVAHAHPTFY